MSIPPDFAVSTVTQLFHPPTSLLKRQTVPAEVVDVNVPEPTSYVGRSYIMLPVSTEDFTELVVANPTGGGGTGGGGTGGRELLSRPVQSMRSPSAKEIPNEVDREPSEDVDRGPTYNPTPTKTDRRLMLVEVYRLSSFLGHYGKGRTLKTLSLFPGERTRISIRTYTRTTTSATRASTIFDSFTSQSATEFATSLESERVNQSSSQKNSAYAASSTFGFNWGIFSNGSASLSASRTASQSREQLAKDVSNASERHASEASARRDITINTTDATSTEEYEETAIVRELSNVNVSKTLNFVFTQMNQEVLTFLHLVDVRIAYSDGGANSYREVPISQLDTLLTEVIAQAKREETKGKIKDAIESLRDVEGVPVTDFAVGRDAQGAPAPLGTAAYWIVNPTKKDTYTYDGIQTEDGLTARSMAFEVPGVIISVDRYVLRTDGVMVRAFVLKNEVALDKYSYLLQEEENRRRRLENDLTQQAIAIAESGDAAKADAFAKVVAALRPATTFSTLGEQNNS